MKLTFNALYKASLLVFILGIVWLGIVSMNTGNVIKILPQYGNKLDLAIIAYANNFMSGFSLGIQKFGIRFLSIAAIFVAITFIFRILKLIATSSIKLRRITASIVDGLILSCGFIAYFIFFPQKIKWVHYLALAKDTYPTEVIVLCITIFCAQAVYFICFEQSKYQATLGKMLLNLKVINEKKNILSTQQAMLRWLFYFMGTNLPHLLGMLFLSLFFLNSSLILLIWFVLWVLPIFFTKDNTTLYDILSKTRVIQCSTGKIY